MKYSFIALITFLILCLSSMTMAQDFGQLLEAVEKIEVSLKEMVTTESDQRQTAIAGLRSELHSLKGKMEEWQSSAGTGNPEQDADLKLKMTQLVEENHTLRAELASQAELIHHIQTQFENSGSVSGNQDYSNQMAKLSAQLIQLKSKMHGLELAQSSDIAVPGPVHVNIPVEAAEEAIGGVEITGFFDVISSYTNSADDEADFNINQAELDFENQLSDNILACAAIAWNGHDEAFELAVAALEIGVYGSEDNFVNSLGFTAGKFDVPFGIDYNVYASPDRKYVTGPQAVDLTHGGWNDFGLQFNMDTKAGNLVIYGVNGFESSIEIIDEVASLALGEDVYEEVDTSPAFAFGTRLGITPLSFVEIGGSFSTGWNSDNENEMVLGGADLQFSLFSFDLKGEYIYHSLNKSVSEQNNRGYYIQGTYGFLSHAFVLSRYGSFKPEGSDWHGQYSFGVGYALIEGVELRFQTLIDEDSQNNSNMFQLVAGF